VLLFFSIGIIAAAFSSADSALASITTTVCVDLLNKKEDSDVSVRRKVHIIISLLFVFVIMLIDAFSQSGILNTIYKIASYTYGPLLGLFFFGLFTKLNVKDKFVPYVCVLAPILCFCLEYMLKQIFDYSVGNEILLFNGLITIVGLFILRLKKQPSKIEVN
jgi:Na+/proline symporter